MQSASLAAALTSPVSKSGPQTTDRAESAGTSDDAMRLLDDPQEWGAFSRPVPEREGYWESHLVIEGMHCAACALTVEDALLAVPGVRSATVSAGSRRARLVWSSEQTSPSGWMEAVQKSGYRAVPAHDALSGERRRLETRKALWRWLVAGLCMMQVMMYAWPAYIAEPGDLSVEMEQLLRWASWVLTLPVIIFSCGPFFSSAWRDVMQRRVSMDLPVALGILITFAVSTAGTFEPQGLYGRQVYFDSLTMFVFFLLTGRWLELRLRDRTAGALDALMNRLPDSVQRQRPDGNFERVAVRRLQPGDVLRILPGEAFPADGVILQGQTQADEALLTGESRPVPRAVGEAVIAGSHNLSAVVLVRVDRVAGQTRFAQIVALMESAATSKPQLAHLADRVAKPFLIAVLLAAAGAAAFWWGRDPAHALMVAVAVLVVTCPCALSLATPVATLSAAGALARRGVLVRRLQALETLAGIDMVVFDKTGTLTRDAMVIGTIQTRPGVSADQALGLAAALAQHSLHPVSRTLLAAAAVRDVTPWSVQEVRETSGQGISGLVMRPESIVGQPVSLGSFQFCGVDGPRPLVPHACLSDASGWLATFELREDVRADASATIASLQALGVEVQLWSGDAPQAVARVASLVGIQHARGGCTPQDKLTYLQSEQQRGKKVAMVGDGLNDGPVLAGANVSVVIGTAVPLAQAQADFVVLGENLNRVLQSLRLSRQTLRIVRQNLWWAAAYNAVCVPLAVVGWMPAWLAGLGMASSSLAVVLNALRLTVGADAERET
jgi:Cu2+-exporting ATPase